MRTLADAPDGAAEAKRHPSGRAAIRGDAGVPEMTREEVGLRFRERMHGALACGPSDHPLEDPVRLSWQPFSIDLAARVFDMEEFLRSPRHRAGFERGTVESDHFGACTVTEAAIDLLVPGHENYEREMCYRVCFATSSGEKFRLLGFKDINGTRFRPWYDTTRILVEVYREPDTSMQPGTAGELVGVGVLQIPVLTFLVQLTTFRPVATTRRAGMSGYARFMWFFFRNLVMPYWAGLFRRTRSDIKRVRQFPDAEELLEQARSRVAPPAP